MVSDFNTFYGGYDPLYTWWVDVPFERLDEALSGYASAIRRMVGIREREPEPIIGDPVLAEGLRAYLAVEMIPYSADELIEIGWKECAWIENQFKQVPNDMVSAMTGRPRSNTSRRWRRRRARSRGSSQPLTRDYQTQWRFYQDPQQELSSL